MNLTLISSAIAAAISFSAAWQLQSARLSDLRTEYATAQFQALEKAHAQTIALQAKADTAARNHAARASTLANDVAGVRSALVSLSDAADGALRAANDSHGACMANASTLRVVFGECTQRRNEVAANAQGHFIDKQALTEAWPVQSKP